MRFVFWRHVASVRFFISAMRRTEWLSEIERTRHAYARIHQRQRGAASDSFFTGDPPAVC